LPNDQEKRGNMTVIWGVAPRSLIEIDRRCLMPPRSQHCLRRYLSLYSSPLKPEIPQKGKDVYEWYYYIFWRRDGIWV
jgi:hypothetical protein